MSDSVEQAVTHTHKDDIGTRMGMWLFLFTELLLFGGMFFIYSVYRFTHQQDFHIAAKELNTMIGTFNTAILLTSSLTMALSIAAIQKGSIKLSIFFQLVTIVLGIGFMVNKYFEWMHHINMGLYPGADELLSKGPGQVLFFGLYYTMTGLHGLHVVIGASVIGTMTVFTIKGVISPESYTKLETAGLYWHLVDIIWIFLFPLFYLIT